MNDSPRFVLPKRDPRRTPVEIIDDGYHSSPSATVQPLPPEVLQHWGLIGSPFAPDRALDTPLGVTDFYFRSSAHASACSWLQSLVSGPGSLAVVTASKGAGATTWLRQLAATSGLGGTALETAVARWENESLEHLTNTLFRLAGDIESKANVKTLWLIHATTGTQSTPAANINRLALLAGWHAARAERLRNLHMVVVTRGKRSLSGVRVFQTSPELRMPTHHLSRPHGSELRRCVNAAMHHAGGTRPAFTVSAVTHLAESSGGSIRRLGALVHTALVHGQIAGIRQITRADLSAPLINHAATVDESCSRAA